MNIFNNISHIISLFRVFHFDIFVRLDALILNSMIYMQLNLILMESQNLNNYYITTSLVLFVRLFKILFFKFILPLLMN